MLRGAVSCDGAYLYADICLAIMRTAESLPKENVAPTPGIDFDPDNGHRYVRLSFAGRTEDMHEARKRIHKFVSPPK